MKKYNHLRRGIAASLAVVMSISPAAPVQSFAQTTQTNSIGEIQLDPQTHYQTLEGWGTSLCWWGNAIGADPELNSDGNGKTNREEIAELAFSPEYLNLNIVRYNVGGGDKADSTIKRVEGRVPGWSQDMFGNDEGNGDFLEEKFYSKETKDMNDSGQIWMLEQANEWRQKQGDIINKVFSNSPPYYMTKSGSSTGGNEWDKENLKSDYYDDFALYLARSTKWLNNNLKVKFGTGIDYIEPLNEPDTSYWINGSEKQEGCIFYPGNSQIQAYKETKNALESPEINLPDVKLTGTDETSLDKAIWSYNHLDAETKGNLDVISAHTYGGNDDERNKLRKIAASYDKGLWMSEVTKGGGAHGTWSHDSMNESSTKWQSEGIMSDIKKMQPTAWISWLVADSEYECIQTDDNWGLIHYVFEQDGPVGGYHDKLLNEDGSKKEGVPDYGYYAVTKQFYTMMQYSKYLKAGYTMVEIGDDNMCAAISPDRKELVVVAQNFGSTRSTSVDLHKLPAASRVQLYRTSDTESCEEVTAELAGSTLQMSLPENSVSTYVITADGDTPLYTMEGYKTIVDCDVQVTQDTLDSGAGYNNKFAYSDGWNDGEWTQEKWTQERNASATFTFTGTQATIYGKKSSNGANLTIKVNEGEAIPVSTVGEGETRRTLLYTTPVLAEGTHTVTIAMAEGQTADKPEIVLEYAEIINGIMEDVILEPLPEYVTATGVVPNLPLTVTGDNGQALPVEWNLSTDLFAVEDYSTVRVTGSIAGVAAQATANVLVVPSNLQYVVDCNNPESALYQKLDVTLDLLNQTPDQKWSDGGWGYLEDYLKRESVSDKNHLDSGWYAGENQSISYQIPLDAGSYSMTFGFKEWWAEWDQYRPMKMTASYVVDGVAKEETLCNATVTDENPVDTEVGTLTLTQDTDVTITVSKTGNQAPVLSYFTIAQTVDHTALIALLGQARMLDRVGVSTDVLVRLDTAIAEGHKLLIASHTTKEASDNGAKIIADIITEISAGSQFTEEELKENDYILYLANCGTPDASVIPNGYKLGLMQSMVNQRYAKDLETGKKWGYEPDNENSRMVASGEDAKDIAESFVYMAPDAVFDKEKSGLKYSFALPEADYEVTVGFRNPWSARNIHVKLEGETVYSDLNLKENQLIERTYVASVTDGELNVMVHSPNRVNEYSDPMMSYIIVRAMQSNTLEMLAEKVKELDAKVADGVWYENMKTLYTEASQAAAKLVMDDSSDSAAIRNAYIALCNAFASLQERVQYDSFSGVKGDIYYDTNGVPIQAHGGQIQQLTVDGETKYYWIGEDKTYDYRPVGGIHVYSSDDLYNWTDEGVVLKTMESKDEFETDPYFKELYDEYTPEEKDEIFIDLDKNNCVIERPKMIYNEKNDQYVIWFHADGRTPTNDHDYGKAKAGIAVSDSPTGPFKLLGSYKLNHNGDQWNGNHGYDGWDGRGSVRDMNLFVDDDEDKTAYVIYSSEGNETTFVSKLNEDYTDLAVDREEAVEGTHFTRNFIGESREAPAIFQYEDKYYMVNSGCTGWSPNPAQYMVADHPMGPWYSKGDPCEGWDSGTTFSTQSTCVFPVDSENGKYIYMGDRWNAGDLSESRYVWLPVEFMDGDRLALKRYENWDLELLSSMGAVKIVTELPEQFGSLQEMKDGMPDQIDVSIGGEIHEDMKVSWHEIDPSKSFAGTYWLNGNLENGKTVTHTPTIVDHKSIYFFDSATEESEYLEVLKEEARGLKNEAADQPYSVEDGAGYIGTEGIEFGKHEGQDLYSSGWWAEENQLLEYQFDLAPGEYAVTTGYQEWWNTKREMKISVVLQDENNGDPELASRNITLNASERSMVEKLDFTVSGTGQEPVSVLVSIEKRGDADPVLSFIGISAKKEETEELASISGHITIEEVAAEGIRANLYEGEISLATPSEATPSQIFDTDESGAYGFTGLEAGTYSVEIPAQDGYRRDVQTVVITEDMADVDFALKREAEEEKLEIRIDKLPQTRRYQIGEELSLTGMEVSLYRSGEQDRTLTEEEYQVSNLDSSTVGTKKITITYTDGETEIICEDSFEVEVYKIETNATIKIIKSPTKKLYQVGEELDLTGIEVRGLNMDEEPIILAEDEFEAVYDFEETGNAVVTIQYLFETEVGDEIALTDVFEVLVYESGLMGEPQADRININQKPYQTVYGIHDAFDPAGIVVEKTVPILASPSNANYKEEIPLEELEFEYEDEDFGKIGKKNVTVVYYTEDENGVERRLEDTITVTVTQKESLLAEDRMNVAKKRLEDALAHGEYVTSNEKQSAFEQAIEAVVDCIADYGVPKEDNFGILKAIEALLLEQYKTTITTTVKADSKFGEVQVDGLALNVDVGKKEPQQIKLQVNRSSEKLPENLRVLTNTQMAMNITLLLEGQEIQPKLPMRIQMEIPVGLEKENLVIYHNHDGSWNMMRPIIRGNQMIFVVSELSVFIVANTKEDRKPSHRDDDDSETTGPAYTIPGSWKLDATGWWYQKIAGGYIASSWARINGQWYYFNDQGYMLTGWVLDNKSWYYLQPDGSMVANQWIQWNEIWYYLTGSGAMAVGIKTPDGFQVGNDGAWVASDKK